MNNKHVLIISFAYPPANYIGAFRVSKISKYLLHYSVIPHVVTAAYDYKIKSEIEIPREYIYYVKWFDLYKYIDKLENINVPIFRLIAKVLKKLIPFGTTRLPEYRRMFWRRPAYKKAIELIKQYPIDLIYSSSSPPASAIVASRVRRATGIPWIAEFRDLWTNNPYNLKPYIFDLIEKRIEKKVLRDAISLVTVSEPLRKKLIEIHNKPAHVIYNGFDEDDYYDNGDFNLSQEFTITYTGSIYEGKRDPSALFQAISILKTRNSKILADLQVNFYGATLGKVVNPLALKFGISEFVFCRGELSNNEIKNIQQKSALLLLLGWNNKSAEGTLTGKIFEYFGAKRPILAIAYPGIINWFLEKTQTGILLTNPEKIADFLEISTSLYKKDNKLGFNLDIEQINKYSRKNQTKELVNVFNNVINK